MYQALYRKWRPLRFADVIGQEPVTSTLRAQLLAGKVGHAYLFTGGRGTGKTTCAKILARAVNCENLQDGDPCGECPACQGILEGSVTDVTEIDAASNSGVENVRDLLEEARYTPAQVKKRVFIIDEVHMLSPGAFNALLKTLEEPPEHVLFILATTELQKVLPTIRSRCQRFDFRRISVDDITAQLLRIAKAESIDLTEGAARLVARMADGAMRDALSMLDRAIAAGGIVDENTVTNALGILGQDDALQFARHIKAGELAEAIALLGEYYDMGRDLAGIFDQLLGLIRDAMLIQAAGEAAARLISPAYSVETLQEFCTDLSPAVLVDWSQKISQSLGRMGKAINARIEAELCAVRLCTFSPIEDVSGGYAARGQPRQAMRQPRPFETGGAAAAEQQGEPAALGVPWPHWAELVDALHGQINEGLYANLKLADCTTSYVENGTLCIVIEDYLKSHANTETVQTIQREAEQLNGGPLPVRILLKRQMKKTPGQNRSGLDAVIRQAKKMHTPVKKM